MKKWILVLFLSLITIISTPGCGFSPYYGNAKIEPGFQAVAGGALTSFYAPYSDSITTDTVALQIGFRGDMFACYGFNRYLAAYMRYGGGLGLMPIYGPTPFVDGALGIHVAAPIGFVTPALRTEITMYNNALDLSPAFLIGVGNPDGIDWVVLGGRTHIYNFSDLNLETLPLDVFTVIHPSPNWSVFFGLNIQTPFLFSLGVGFPLDMKLGCFGI